jgi:hypothetical protein
MFRRRFIVFRRPRLLGTALVGGLGFAAGRASKKAPPPPAAEAPDVAARLKELADLHATGALTDQEFEAAKRSLLGS